MRDRDRLQVESASPSRVNIVLFGTFGYLRIDRHGRGNIGFTLFDLSHAQFRDATTIK
jgi:hypothetical protein